MSLRFVHPSIAILLSSLAGLVNAQSVDVGGPVVGFIHQAGTHAVRPVVGIPGAAWVGAPVLSDVASAFPAPGGRWALFGRDGKLWLARGLSRSPAITPMPDAAIEAVDRVAWNRDGSIALLYSASNRLLQRIHISDAEVFADPPVAISWGDVSALAIDAAGRLAVIGVPDSGLYVLRNGQSPALVSTIAQPTAVAFDESGRRLYAVDAAAKRIVEFDSAYAESEFASLVEADGSTLDPIGMVISRNGRYLLVADRATRSVRVYETAARALATTLALTSAPSRLEAFSTEPAFLLNEPGAGECLLVLNAGDSPGVYFVPADQEAQR